MITDCIQPSIGECIRPAVGDPRKALFRARFSPAATNYFSRLDAAGLRVTAYDAANARLIDRLVEAGGNFWPDSGAFVAMAGYLFPSAGTLVPLHPNHDAGTLVDFVTGDWNAVTGQIGDGISKYVNSNRAAGADPQNDISLGTYVNAGSGILIGNGSDDTGAMFLRDNVSRNRNSTADTVTGFTTGYIGSTRSLAAEYLLRNSGTNTTITRTSQTPRNRNMFVYGVPRGAESTPNFFGSARQPFYHIGPNLSGTGELALIDTIITDWQTDLANA